MRLTLLVAFVCGPSGSLHCQTACAAEHYRWTEKTSVALATKAATRTTVRQMLAWDTLAVDGKKAYQCGKRRGLERNVYSVTGWVRRVGSQVKSSGYTDLLEPMRMKFIGLAFFDEEHRRKAPNRLRGNRHGPCDLTVWETHPVKAVLRP